MKTYKLNWKQVMTGISYIEANSKKEAAELAEQGKDKDFETSEDAAGIYPDWKLTEIEECD
jgi:hypothetical protein